MCMDSQTFLPPTLTAEQEEDLKPKKIKQVFKQNMHSSLFVHPLEDLKYKYSKNQRVRILRDIDWTHDIKGFASACC